MSEAKRPANLAAYSIGSLYPRSTARTRNLGSAIVMAAIADYRGRDEEAHQDAELFLYPASDAARRHYDWAVALNDEINATWLRESLDRSRPVWDAERARWGKKQRRVGYEKRIRLGGRRVHAGGAGIAGAAVEPARAASAAGAYEAAAGV